MVRAPGQGSGARGGAASRLYGRLQRGTASAVKRPLRRRGWGLCRGGHGGPTVLLAGGNAPSPRARRHCGSAEPRFRAKRRKAQEGRGSPGGKRFSKSTPAQVGVLASDLLPGVQRLPQYKAACHTRICVSTGEGVTNTAQALWSWVARYTVQSLDQGK